MSKEGHVDLERISNSIETLSSVENIVNLVNLEDNFEDIEKCFRQINFEHANCLSYKEPLDVIYQDLNNIKRKVNELSDALRRTKINYTTINTFSDKDIKEFSKLFKGSSSSEELAKLVGTKNSFKITDLNTELNIQNNNNVTKIPAPTEQTTEQGGTATTVPDTYITNTEYENITTIPQQTTIPEQTTQNEPINTVPIGIAIGATGIAGSVGAVIVDDIYRKREKNSKKIKKEDVYMDDYNEDDIIEEDYDYDQIRNSSGIAQGPYRAARFSREADRFYGNQLQDMNLSDDEEYLDEYDDDYEDF